LAGIPAPHFAEYQSGFLVEFRKNIYTEEYLRQLGLNERQIKAVMYVKERGRITNKEYQELTNISRKQQQSIYQKWSKKMCSRG